MVALVFREYARLKLFVFKISIEMAASMLRVPVMTEETKKFKQSLPTNFILAEPVAVDGSDLIQVSIGGRLLSSQISINELGKQLLKAAGEGNLEEVKTLMSKGAAFTADWLGTTPLHLAAQNNHLEICEILLRAGISKDARTKVDRTPLHMAVYEGHTEIVETLLAIGADCDCKDMLLMTPLHWAAQNGHAEIAALLIKYGATTDLVNKFNLTPVDIAKQIDRMDIVQIIESATPDPMLASHHLAVQLADDCNSDSNIEENDAPAELCTPVVTVLMEDDVEENSRAPESSNNNNDDNNRTENPASSDHEDDCQQEQSLVESLKILQQHGITMLPSEEQNILSSAVENGHSVVLTEVGKEMLNSMKAAEARDVPDLKPPQHSELKKYVTITPEEFFALTGSSGANNLTVTKQITSGKPKINVKHSVKRVVMKKNKTRPILQSSNNNNVAKAAKTTDMETVMKQLIEARKMIEEYKVKLMKKEAEAERYKQQLKIMMEGK